MNIQQNIQASPYTKTGVSTVYAIARNVFKLLDDICNDQTFKDTKGLNKSRKSKKKRQYNWKEDKGQKEKQWYTIHYTDS